MSCFGSRAKSGQGSFCSLVQARCEDTPLPCEGHTSIMSWRPGIDVAVHTEAQLLSAAAYAEFRQAVQDRLDRGDRVQALFCGRVSWCSSTTLPRQGCLAGPQNFRPYVNRPVPRQRAPLHEFSGQLCLPLDWNLDTPGYGRGSGQLCGPSPAAVLWVGPRSAFPSRASSRTVSAPAPSPGFGPAVCSSLDRDIPGP